MFGSKATILVMVTVAVLLVGSECARLGGAGRDSVFASNIRGRVKSAKFFQGANNGGTGCTDPSSNKVFPLHSVIQMNSKLCQCVKLDGMMKFAC